MPIEAPASSELNTTAVQTLLKIPQLLEETATDSEASSPSPSPSQSPSPSPSPSPSRPPSFRELPGEPDPVLDA